MMTTLTPNPHNTINSSFNRVALPENKRFEPTDDFCDPMIVGYSSWERFICHKKYGVRDFVVRWGE
ncbi:hypothetical protein B9Q08_03280 [Candidatus Marsarchaeota G2 archaeon ECH_B_SAG-M15]|jgi:hypothetical protein|uniref:Uncharacterized protein n=1 Tax=Candidatus Marsarchaeota G2 archaeon ECH_B_SAG-M15 TaxID=1978162 RepID=A0A2R6AXX5_9ARCH|nr:MAG: hypothetical protein B9Q08_03280 [Candidatus Marsarchaeota G2 archaeon ECH_B_SAG-M15]